MAEYKKIEGREKFDYSRMGKQTHRDFLKVKPKIQAKQSGGCMDPSALNYDPLATADCNGTVGGSNTDCCEYPCHKLLI
tara:strand:+ start:6343 stop:6579 length:237 start_codon:yes stop_codon:yes gene_type:complete